MNMGYECISPFEDLDNCGGCVALGQGIACESLPGVRKTECNRGRCVNRQFVFFFFWFLDGVSFF